MAPRARDGGRSDVEREIDRIFEQSPEQFVAERDALAKQLRASGDTEGAAAVARLRRPTVAAWALDQLARRKPDEIAELVALGEELQRAQRRALSGVGADELRELGTRRRRVVEQLARESERILHEAGRPPSPAVHQAITNTLEAATVSEDDAAALLEGRLVRDLTPQSGFGAVDGLSVVEAPPRAARATTAPNSRAKTTKPSGPERRRVDAARQRVEQAGRSARERNDIELRASNEYQHAEQAADDAGARVEELEAALRDARSELDEARRQSRAARRELDAARKARIRAEQDLEAARSALERLDSPD
jgi:hypothetical protein